MKITLINIVHLSNALIDIEAINENLNPQFTAWKKRFQIYIRPEVAIWNGLSIEERRLVGKESIKLPLEKLKPEFQPGIIPEDLHSTLSLIFDGEIEKQEPKIRQLLKKHERSRNSTPEKADQKS